MLSIGPYKAPLVSWAHYATLLAAGPVLARAWSTSPKPDTATEQIHRSPGLPLGRPAMLPSWGLKSTALPQGGEGVLPDSPSPLCGEGRVGTRSSAGSSDCF